MPHPKEVKKSSSPELEKLVEEQTIALARARDSLITEIAYRKRAEDALLGQERIFRQLFNNTNDSVTLLQVMSDGHFGRFLEVNDIACERLQYTKEELLQMSVRDIRIAFVTDEMVRFLQDLEENAQEQKHVMFESRFVRKDGIKIPVEINEIITEYRGQKAALVIARDITERRRAEEALKESEERYRNVIEDQTEFICRFLPDGTHIFVNDAYCQYFDKKRDEVIGHRFRPVLHPEDREIVERHIASITSEHPVMDIDQRIIMPDGSIRWQRWSDRAIFDQNGRVMEYQSVGRDITEQKTLEVEMKYHEQALIQLSSSLSVVNKKLNLLTSITRHDINNQLTILQGYLEILQNVQLDPLQNEYFRKVTIAAERIAAMIRFTKEYEAIGVNAPVWQDIQTLVDTAKMEALVGQILVKNDLPADTEVFADSLIVKVFYNLMDNAVRYGGKITTIRFPIEESRDYHLIVCEDDGDGVPAEEKEKIFERGFGKNTGLGLALSREILSITDITITETGKPGKGARFEMVVPSGMYR
jgi:PAS domain S-box-containing protein